MYFLVPNIFLYASLQNDQECTNCVGGGERSEHGAEQGQAPLPVHQLALPLPQVGTTKGGHDKGWNAKGWNTKGWARQRVGTPKGGHAKGWARQRVGTPKGGRQSIEFIQDTVLTLLSVLMFDALLYLHKLSKF
jgi:hypothetical protein